MACTLTAINAEDCVIPYGGIHTSYIIPMTDIDDITFGADNEITGFTLIVTPEMGFTKFVVEDDDSAYFNQTGERNNKMVFYNGETFMKFVGVDQKKVNAGNGIAGCCALLAVHFMNNGRAIAQGIGWDPDKGASGAWVKSQTKLKATPSLLTGTGEEEDRLEITLTDKSRFLAPTVDMVEADIEAL